MDPTRTTRLFALASSFFLIHGVLAAQPASGVVGLLGLVFLVQTRWAFQERLGDLTLSARREVEAHLPRPHDPVFVEVQIQGRGQGLVLEFEDELPPGATLEADPVQTGGPPPTTIRYTCTFRDAGVHEWDDLSVQVGDPLGLWSVKTSLPAENSVQVAPSRETLRRARRRAEREEPGLRRENLEEVLFEDLELARVRPYEPGDRPRDIDWKRSAEQQNLLVRHLEEAERQHNLVIVLDEPPASHELRQDRWDEVRRLALEIVGVALDRRMAVGCLLTNGTQVRGVVDPTPGAEAMNRIEAMMRSTGSPTDPGAPSPVLQGHPGWDDDERRFLRAVDRWSTSDAGDLGHVMEDLAHQVGGARITFLALTDLVDEANTIVRDLVKLARRQPHVIVAALPPRTRDRRLDEPRLDDLESAYRREIRRDQALRLLEERGCSILDLPRLPTFDDLAEETARRRPGRVPP